MPKIATSWVTNKAIQPDKFDTSQPYDGTGSFDNQVAGESTITTAKPQSWGKTLKTATDWMIKPKTSGQFDTTDKFDTANSFDDQVGSVITTKKANSWVSAVKDASNWAVQSLISLKYQIYDSKYKKYDSASLVYDDNTKRSVVPTLPAEWRTT